MSFPDESHCTNSRLPVYWAGVPKKTKAQTIREYVEAHPEILSDAWIIAEAGKRRNAMRKHHGTNDGAGGRPPLKVYHWRGKEMSIPQIAKLEKIYQGTLRNRIDVQGMTIEQAVAAGPKKRAK